MKRTMLLIALLGLTAGAAFAETAPVFSGTFSTYFAYEFSSGKVKDKAANDVKLDLAATIDEWNTVSVSLTTKNALMWTDKGQGGAKKDKKINTVTQTDDTTKLSQSNEISSSDGYLKLGDFTLTTDVLGALGIDAPVSIKTKVGKFGFKTANVADVAAKSVKKVGGNGTAKGVGIGVDVTLFDMVTVSTVVYPKSVVEKGKNAEAGVTVKATGILDMIDVAAYFISSDYDRENDPDNEYKIKDGKGENMGASVAAAPIDGLKIGLGFNCNLSVFTKVDGTSGENTVYNPAPITFAFQADTAFTMIDGLNVGLSLGLTDIIGAKDFFKFVDKGSAFFSVGYDVFDNLNVSGAVGLQGLFGKGFKLGKIPYDVAVTTSFGGLEVRIGASNEMKDFKAPEKDFDDALYLKFSTSF